MNIVKTKGNLLDQDVDVIVNAWNRNIFPYWLLIPQGVSGAIRKKAGTAPFKELAKYGTLKLGDAVLTCSGKLPFKGIIHVAGINFLWVATEISIIKSVQSAMEIVNKNNFGSVAFPLIGAGTGGFKTEKVMAIMSETLGKIDSPAEVIIVQYQK